MTDNLVLRVGYVAPGTPICSRPSTGTRAALLDDAGRPAGRGIIRQRDNTARSW